MRGKRTIGMTLMALVLTTSVGMVMRSQPEADPSTEPLEVGRSRGRERPEATSGKPGAFDARITSSQLHAMARLDELSTADEARLRRLRQSTVDLTEIPNALIFLQSLPDQPEIRELIVALIRQWAESDAPSAVQWAEAQPTGEVRQECLKGIALAWAKQDLDGAIQWATHLPEGDERNEVLRGAAYEAARSEPLKALSIAVGLPTSLDNDALIQHSALQWASHSPEEAARWATGISDPVLRDRVISVVATAWGDSNPVAAATLALSEISSGRAQDDAVVGIVQRWLQIDRQAAEEWVKSFPDGTLRKTANEYIAKLHPK